jgi:hypothetical protein
MLMKSMYNFSNQHYNNIIKLIIDLIPSKHDLLKDLYHPKKIVSDLSMNNEKIDACEEITCFSRRSIRMTLNVCIVISPGTRR